MAATEQAIEQQIIMFFNNFEKKEQNFAFDFLKHLSNQAYLAKIQRGIDQCAEGRGIVRDIIELDEDEDWQSCHAALNKGGA